MEAETYAAHAYDGMNLMLWAINAAGLNRAKIRDVVAFLPHPWPGVTGDIVFSACLDDVADTYLATYRDGRWKYVSRTELGIPKGYVAPRDRLNRDQYAVAPAAPAKATAEEVSRPERAARLLLLALVLGAAGAARGEPPARPEAEPYRKGGQEPLDFRGPGRDEPEPDVTEVVLGWFGPGEPRSPGLRRPLARRDSRARAGERGRRLPRASRSGSRRPGPRARGRRGSAT